MNRKCALALALFVLSVPCAWADVVLSDAVIASDTHWAMEEGPYLLSGTTRVRNGARLSIDAGTTIYMSAGAALVVEGGYVEANGARERQILVTSDLLRSGQDGYPGAWGTWAFLPGGGPSKLEWMVIEYGSGVVVQGAAPTISHATIRHHQGPAVTADLAASPSGAGNTALGNTINAVLVPAGDISGAVDWGLRGIPYLVASGTLSVGTSPAVNTLSPAVVEQGETVIVDATGSRLSGLSEVMFGAVGLTGAPQSGGTATQATFSVSADADAPIGSSTVSLLVDAGVVQSASGIAVVRPQPKVIGLEPQSIYAGQGPVPVHVTGKNFSAQAQALLNGNAIETAVASSTSLTATVPSQSSAGSLQIAVQIPDPDNSGQFFTSAPATLAVATSSLVLVPEAVAADVNGSEDLALTILHPAPAGGLTFDVTSSTPAVATAPATATILEGLTSVAIPISAIAPGSATITVTHPGFTTVQTQIFVAPPPQPERDPYFSNVASLIHFDGADGSTAVLDQTGKAWTMAGGAATSAASSKFGGSAVYTGSSRSGNAVVYGNTADASIDLAGDFTIEAWAYLAGDNEYDFGTLFSKADTSYRGDLAISAFEVGVYKVGGIYYPTLLTFNTTAQHYSGTGSVAVQANVWTHVALVRKGDVVKLYVDGVESLAITVTGAVAKTSQRLVVGATYQNGTSALRHSFNGYIDEFRVTNGFARYTESFLPPAEAFQNEGADLYFANVRSLLHFNGANGSTSFNDQKGVAWVPTGTAQISTDKVVLRESSAKLNGTAGYISTAAGHEIALGAGDWTVEFWVNLQAYSSNGYGFPIMQYGVNAEGTDGFAVEIFSKHDGTKQLWLRNAYSNIVGGMIVSLNTPLHIAVVKTGSTARIVLNGKTWSSGLSIGDLGTPRKVTLGQYSGAWLQNKLFYMDEFRATVGIARYAGTFTPAVGEFANQGP